MIEVRRVRYFFDWTDCSAVLLKLSVAGWEIIKLSIPYIISSILLRIITIICGFILQKLIIKTYGSDTNGLIVN